MMKMGRVASEAQRRAIEIISGITGFAKLERVLAALCILVPLLLIMVDNLTVRKSISAYYNMTENQLYYFPLTMLSMLFIFNGVVKQKIKQTWAYNTVLGLSLAGVILFNVDDAKPLHYAFAIIFFVGNGAVILVYSSKKEMWFKVLIAIGILIAFIGFYPFHFYTLFWAEWFSFGLIALHFIIESKHDDRDVEEVLQKA